LFPERRDGAFSKGHAGTSIKSLFAAITRTPTNRNMGV
jgi:hypothetical protein